MYNLDRPDLILLDLNTPGMDGFEFLEAFRDISQSAVLHVSIAILSASEYPGHWEKAKLYGVSTFLEKPLTEEKLISLVVKAR